MKIMGAVVLAAVVALGVGACSSGGSGNSSGSGGSGSSATPGFTTSCKITGTDDSGQGFYFKVTMTAQKASDVTDVDVEFLKQGAPLSTSGTGIGDGGVGILMSKLVGAPGFLSAGQTWTGSNDDPNGSIDAITLPAVPDSCQVTVVATTSDPGNF